MNHVTIYALCCPLTHTVKYVGQTNNLSIRLKYHLNDNKPSPKSTWIKLLESYDLKPSMIMLEIVPEDVGNERELFWINLFKDKNTSLLNNIKFTPRTIKCTDPLIPVDTKTYVMWKSKQTHKDLLHLGLLLNATQAKTGALMNKRKLTEEQFEIIDSYFKNKPKLKFAA
jgi:hypothetical protein